MTTAPPRYSHSTSTFWSHDYNHKASAWDTFALAKWSVYKSDGLASLVFTENKWLPEGEDPPA